MKLKDYFFENKALRTFYSIFFQFTFVHTIASFSILLIAKKNTLLVSNLKFIFI